MDDRFYSDGTIRVERYTLHKDGYDPIKIRKILGDWEYLAYTQKAYGMERWEKLPQTEDVIQENITKYGV